MKINECASVCEKEYEKQFLSGKTFFSLRELFCRLRCLSEKAPLAKRRNRDGGERSEIVTGGKAEVQIWFSNKTPAAVEKLKALGFEVSEEKRNKFVVGKIAIEKITDLAEIAEVQYVLPQIK